MGDLPGFTIGYHLERQLGISTSLSIAANMSTPTKKSVPESNSTFSTRMSVIFLN